MIISVTCIVNEDDRYPYTLALTNLIIVNITLKAKYPYIQLTIIL